MLTFHCTRCQNTVFFENVQCEHCGAALGFDATTRQMVAFDWLPCAEPTLTPAPALPAPMLPALKPCANRWPHGVCNWLLDVQEDASWCRSCRLNQIIPDLSDDANVQRWRKIEIAKRRMLFTLLELDLLPLPKRELGDPSGLAFHFLATPAGDTQGPKTGHNQGVITLNIAEADDAEREARRVRLGEPSRTLLGHFRHEVSHYLQYAHVTSDLAVQHCRDVFGDERDDYALALRRHYEQGPPPDWSSRFVSSYASSHPWEDWAETCAHYLLVLDALETATAWGLSLNGSAAAVVVCAGDVAQAAPASTWVVEQWLPVAQFLNAMNRSVGTADAYPFLVPVPVVNKMAAVQSLLVSDRVALA